MGKVIMSGIVPKLSEPVIPTKDFPIGDLAVGSPVWLNVSGVPTEFLVVQRGNPDTSLYDASCDGVWLMMKGLYDANTRWIKDTPARYDQSNVHDYLNNTFLNLLDDAVKNKIIQVKIPYTKGEFTIYSGTNGLSTRCFLPAGAEVGAKNYGGAYAIMGDGSCLEYFKGATDETRIAYKDGVASHWGLRTPTRPGAGEGSTSQSICIVQNDGYINIGGSPIGKPPWRPLMILPYDALVNEDGIVVGVKGGA